MQNSVDSVGAAEASVDAQAPDPISGYGHAQLDGKGAFVPIWAELQSDGMLFIGRNRN
eukprot:SAG11_NODE_5385_length_1576_cov_1.186188_1_plen_58_part_00